MDNYKYLEKYYTGSNLETAKEKLLTGIPIQYIIGNVDFYGNVFKVNENVLIPRFETELLVEKTINYINKYFSNKKLDIIDLGTGSGCIAITLKKELNCNMDAVDISKKALEVARKNALINKTDVNFIENNMLSNNNKKYDVIISNPPYIDINEEIMDIVKNNEPTVALYADNKGLYYYEEILKKAKNNLKDNYLMGFEIGYQQGEKIKKIALKYLSNIEVFIEKDYSNKDRYIFIKNREGVEKTEK